MKGIFVGIDIGTTVLKVAAYDGKSGALLTHEKANLPVPIGAEGSREQSAAKLASTLFATLFRLRDNLGHDWCHVAGLGLAAQGGSMIIVESTSARPLTPMILWNDPRAIPHFNRVHRKKSAAFWRRVVLREKPGMGLGRFLWLRETRPELLHSGNLCVGAGDYAFFLLTGQWRQDPCHALQMGAYNAAEERLDQRLLDLVGLPLSFVPPLRQGHETAPLAKNAARRLQLPEGIPVAGPYMDHEAGFLAVHHISHKPLQCSLGTAWVGNFVVPQGLRSISAHQLVLPPLLEGAGRLNVQPLLTGNVTWNWGLSTFVHPNLRRALELAQVIFKTALLPAKELVALPWLNVANPLFPDTLGGAAFVGMSPMTNRADLLRALAAGMTFEMARVFRACIDGAVVDSAVLGGGASKGVFFQCLLSALFTPLPTFLVEEEDLAGTRGTLHIFGTAASRARVTKLSKPPIELVNCVRHRYENYLKVFARVYGNPQYGSLEFLKIRAVSENRHKESRR